MDSPDSKFKHCLDFNQNSQLTKRAARLQILADYASKHHIADVSCLTKAAQELFDVSFPTAKEYATKVIKEVRV